MRKQIDVDISQRAAQQFNGRDSETATFDMCQKRPFMQLTKSVS